MNTEHRSQLLSVVVPTYNEEAGIDRFCISLIGQLEKLRGLDYEVIFVNDGSRDDTIKHLLKICRQNKHIKLLSLTRNFGKEVATTAGINNTIGDAIITLDSDGQHPVEMIRDFVEAWEKGEQIIVGVRSKNHGEGVIKKYGSKIFYKIFNKTTGIKMVPGSTDFRLIDRSVQQEFVKLTERNRITRGLIDWLGYEPKLIYFKAKERELGAATYSTRKLFKLAVNSIVSLSDTPLYFASFLGTVISACSALLLAGMAIETSVGDPLSLKIKGSAYVVVVILLLVGVLLFSQGLLGLYLAHIHAESLNRPLYVINHRDSFGISDTNKVLNT